jgi:ParB-like chromosome segregation protein Spo0J
MNEEDIVTYLKVSGERAGRLYPVLLDKHGNIIDGIHRLTADKKWPKITIENIETEEQRLIARIISNICRRHIPAKEKREMLGRLGEIYLKEGVEQGKIAYKIAEKTGMSYRWVMKYLPSSFKDGVKSESAHAARRAAEDAKRSEEPKEIVELMKSPKEKILTIQKYANTHFVNVIVEKPFYTQLERMAEKLGTTPEVLISNILLKGLKELEGRLEEEKK